LDDVRAAALPTFEEVKAELGQQMQQQMQVMGQAIEELQKYIAQLEQSIKGQHIGMLSDPQQAAQREVIVDAAQTQQPQQNFGGM
jgi:uncharacterized protein Yka (UPF0111/DUF47 family)